MRVRERAARAEAEGQLFLQIGEAVRSSVRAWDGARMLDGRAARNYYLLAIKRAPTGP